MSEQSFLDQLKRDAEATKANGGRSSATASVKAGPAELQQGMAMLFRFASELVEYLNVVKPEVMASYEIPNFGALRHLSQGGYDLQGSRTDHYPEFALLMVCEGNKGLNCLPKSTDQAEGLRRFVDQHRLRYRAKFPNDWNSDIRVEPFVSSQFWFSSQEDKGQIRLRIVNHEELGEVSYGLNPSVITSELLDELAKRVVRKPNKFSEMAGFTVPDDMRAKLQARLAADREAKQAQEAELDMSVSVRIAKGALDALRRRN